MYAPSEQALLTFTASQERNSEVATLKKEKAALVAQHQLELEHYKALYS